MSRVSSHITESESRHIFGLAVSSFSSESLNRGDLLFREIGERDYGIDGGVEIFSHGEPTGRFAWIQLKGTEKKIETLRNQTMIACPGISKSNMMYCKQRNCPVILVYCSVDDKKFYYIDLQSVVNGNIPDQKSYTVHIPVENNSDNLSNLVNIINSYYDGLNLTHQVFNIADFVRAYDNNSMNAPLDTDFLFREEEINRICESVNSNFITVINGASGIGKTRLALEVCRKYEENGWAVWCVKSNERLLYNDIDYYLNQQGKQLLFFDDANTVASLKNVLETISSLKNVDIRILMTVRDYAKDNVIRAIRTYKSNTFEIGVFTTNEIKEILKENYNIQNDAYLKRITEVAAGNVRLAAMAAIRAAETGLQAIENAEDIFKVYYDPVIDNAGLTKDELVLLSIISVAGAVRNNSNQLYQTLCHEYLPDVDIDKSLHRLYELEFIDWFKEEIIKIADQSCGNYILYYVLYVKKWITLETLVAEHFPKYKNRIVYAVNSLVNLFCSDTMLEYIRQCVSKAWDESKQEYHREYLKAFYQLDTVKGLLYLKRFVEVEQPVYFDLNQFNFNKEAHYRHIRTDEIEILAGYSKTEEIESAVDLMLDLYDKRPDLVMDFYFAITDNICNQYSLKRRFKYEHILVAKLLTRCQAGNNYKYTYLFTHIAAKLLECEINYTEPTGRRSFSFVTRELPASSEIIELRHMVLGSLLEIYHDARYRSAVTTILRSQRYNRHDISIALELCQADVDQILNYFKKQPTITFEDALVLNTYKQALLRLGGCDEDRFSMLSTCFEYKVYDVFTREHLQGKSFEDEESDRRLNIANEVKTYCVSDYGKLFNACKIIESSERSAEWQLATGIAVVFELLEKDAILFDVAKKYFEAGAPTLNHQYKLIDTLLLTYGYDEVHRMAYDVPEAIKDKLLAMLFQRLEEKNITKKVKEDFVEFQDNQLSCNNPIILPLKVISKYVTMDSSLIERVSRRLLSMPDRIGYYFGYDIKPEDAGVVKELYIEKFELLEDMYFKCNCSHFDYYGVLFELIFKHSADRVWQRFIGKLKENKSNSSEKNIFRLIWETYYSFAFIDQAFSVLIEEAVVFSDETVKMIFYSGKDDSINMLQKSWFIEKMNRDYRNISTMSHVISAVAIICPDYKNELILRFIELNHSIEDFKRLSLFSESYTIVGSEIPFFNDRIHSLEVLCDSMSGANYIEHKAYLQKLIKGYKKQKDEAEIREYLENERY